MRPSSMRHARDPLMNKHPTRECAMARPRAGSRPRKGKTRIEAGYFNHLSLYCDSYKL
ncbi:hypothetical protein L514_0673 [Bordetella bronchiseptica MBORD635]|nr:hypothetical protein L514_0673 [Bordetella bronchiseptica MBORD635]